jgi:hypothetical protein
VSGTRIIRARRSMPLSDAPRSPRQPKKAYIHQDENGGTIDLYFAPMINMQNSVSVPDRERLCVNETVWNQYYSLCTSDVGEDEGDPAARSAAQATAQATNHTRLGLSFQENGTWVPVPGAHFQGGDCEARLLSTFSGDVLKLA